MKIIFLGTRGYIDAKTKWHRRHTATIIMYKKKHVLIDCGIDWLNLIGKKIAPDAIIITHAHPDHAFGLKQGSPCPVYAPRVCWRGMKKFPIEDKRMIAQRKPITICGITFEAFSVEHSILAPAFGYRISAGKSIIFYVPDLIKIKQQRAALKNINLYIGDGAAITKPIVRQKNGVLFGHTTIRAQLGWCEKEKVKRAIFTHCGSAIVKSDKRVVDRIVRELGDERSVEASIAYDGLTVEV